MCSFTAKHLEEYGNSSSFFGLNELLLSIDILCLPQASYTYK